MRTAIVIPARYASTRLPGKVLLRETGKHLVEHVYQQAIRCRRARDVLVATDDMRVRAACASFGAPAVMTGRHHRSGTERVAEAAQGLTADVVVNVQGDEPMIDPAHLDLLPALLADDPRAQMATLACPIRSEEVYRDPNCVKVVLDRLGRALYFSRSPVPAVRDGVADFAAGHFLQHIGVYAYRREALLSLARLPPCGAERLESLEQLRALDQGWRVRVACVPHASQGVDTWAQYRRFVRAYRAGRRGGLAAA